MKILVLVAILLVVITSSQSTNTYCGSRLVDRLQVICQFGIRGMKSVHLARRYPNLRRRYYRHKRSHLEILAHINALDKENRFKELLLSEKLNSPSGLEVLLRIAHNIRKEEIENGRSRRSVTAECCRKACTIKTIRQKYCARRRY